MKRKSSFSLVVRTLPSLLVVGPWVGQTNSKAQSGPPPPPPLPTNTKINKTQKKKIKNTQTTKKKIQNFFI